MRRAKQVRAPRRSQTPALNLQQGDLNGCHQAAHAPPGGCLQADFDRAALQGDRSTGYSAERHRRIGLEGMVALRQAKRINLSGVANREQAMGYQPVHAREDDDVTRLGMLLEGAYMQAVAIFEQRVHAVSLDERQ